MITIGIPHRMEILRCGDARGVAELGGGDLTQFYRLHLREFNQKDSVFQLRFDRIGIECVPDGYNL